MSGMFLLGVVSRALHDWTMGNVIIEFLDA